MDAVDMDTAEDPHAGTIEEIVPEVCRICLLGHMIMRNIFAESEVLSLSTKAMSFASVKMLPEDGLPSQVCCECADKLEAAYDFKLQVEQADSVLRQRYDALNIKEELFFNEVEVHLEAERGEEVHSLDVDAHYRATVESLNSVDSDDGKPTLLKDHLALLEVEKLAKEHTVMEVQKHEDVMGQDGVTAMLETSDEHAEYLDDGEGNVELADCNEDCQDDKNVMQDPEAVTAEEHNYIMQQGYALTRNQEELVAQESVDCDDNETVNYLSLMDEEMQQKDNQSGMDNNEESDAANNEVSETRRSKRKLGKRRTNDEDNYFENLNLSSRLKQSQIESDKCYFLCFVCDKQFVSKEILKDHMHSHEELRHTLSAKKVQRMEKSSTAPTTPPNVSSTTTSVSGKKANKCPYCGKEYLYVISFNKHLKQHEKSKDVPSQDSSFSQEEYIEGEIDESSDFAGYDELRESEGNNRLVINEGKYEDAQNVEDNRDNEGTSRNDSESSPHKRKRRATSSKETTIFMCDKCPEKFKSKRELVDHTSGHFNIFKCSTCDQEFDALEKLRRHRTEHVVEGVLSQEDLEDNIYEREFISETPSNDGMYEKGQEMEVDGQQNEENDEDDMDDRGDSENSWRLEVEPEDEEEMKEIRMERISENWQDVKNLKCPNCSIVCSSKHSLVKHLETHGEISRPRICKLCKLEFTSDVYLQQHVEQEHSSRTKTFKCTECSKIFLNELTLRNHLFETNHKTIIHGQQYDPNKRIKRVAAKAAQKIIDKIKTEDDLEDSEEDEAEKSESMDEQEARNPNVRWPRQNEKTPEIPRKVQGRRNNRRQDYECESCGRKCRSKQSLAKHMEQHRAKDEKLATPEKSQKFSPVAEKPGPVPTPKTKIIKLEDETNDENSDFESGLDWPVESHECPSCKKKYSTKKSLLRHQLLHKAPSFACDICNVKFYRKDKLKSHYDKCSEKNPDQVRKCNICGDTFENNEILKEHRSRHVDEGILTEEDLRDIEPGSEERKEIMKVVRKRRTDIVGLECTECNKCYTSRKGLLRHIQVHEGKKYLCDICPKKFYRPEHLKIHVAKHNMIKPYKCPRCTKRFIKEDQLSNHLSRHDRTFKKPKEADTSKRFLCEICSKSFTQSTTLIAHLRVHNGIKPYVCEVCARPFTTNAYLKMHMRTHTQERPYSCQYCSRAFARADTLANHLTSHTGEAKYHCKYCPKNFRRLKSLKEHVFIHTGQRPYACPTCDRRFNNNGSRYAHSKRCKQNHMQNASRIQNAPVPETILESTIVQPIRLHQLAEAHEMIEHEEHEPQMELVKSQGIKTITLARATDELTGTQMIHHQEILMPLILPLTVTLTDADEEVILPEGTKIYTTA